MWVSYTPVAVPVNAEISLRGQDVFNHEIGEWTREVRVLANDTCLSFGLKAWR